MGKERTKKILFALKEHLFNPKWKCNACEEEIFNGQYFCSDCQKSLPIITSDYCEKCGRQLKAGSTNCTDCKERMIYVDKARSLYSYEGAISKLIKGLKFYNKKYVVDIFINDLSNLYFKSYFNADNILFVPMTIKAESVRGFNQSKLIAEKLAQATNVPLLDGVSKVKETKRQSTLNGKERLENVKGAFKLKKGVVVKDKTIVLVDDVFTTGATSEAIAKVLKDKGASKVYLLTVSSLKNKKGY